MNNLNNLNCRYCGSSLDGGDVYEVLARLAYYRGKTPEELKVAAGTYGWTPANRTRFKREIIVQPLDQNQQAYTMCPDCRGKWPLSKDMPRAFHQECKDDQDDSMGGCEEGRR